MQVDAQWFGLTPYQQGLRLQETAFTKTKQNGYLSFLGMEHPLVLTLGLRSHLDRQVDFYRKIFPEVVLIRRGGHLVVHNPGQLVIYPVIPLNSLGLGVRDYVCLLMKTTRKWLLTLGIESAEKAEPGLYTRKGKIAMFGVEVKNGITQHGLCVNVNNDLGVFAQVSLCNVTSESLDQIAHYQKDLNLETLFVRWTEMFKENLLCYQSCVRLSQSPPLILDEHEV